MSMPGKWVRGFQRADDVFEYCLILGARRIRRAWRAWLLLAGVTLAWSGWESPPPAPLPEATAALPGLTLPGPDPLVLPSELDLIDEELALWDDQLDIDREPASLVDLKLSLGVELPQTTFDVLKVERRPEGERAKIRFNGAVLEVREGSIVPSVDAPALVITDIGSDRILALDVWSHRMLDREVPWEGVWEQPVTLIAVAGETPDFVAVVEFEKETYIVQPGTGFPDEDRPRIIVSEIFADRLIYTVASTNESRVIHRIPEPAPMDPPDLEEIDIPDISP